MKSQQYIQILEEANSASLEDICMHSPQCSDTVSMISQEWTGNPAEQKLEGLSWIGRAKEDHVYSCSKPVPDRQI